MEPSPRKSKNNTKSRMKNDPSENIDMIFFPQTKKENAPFVRQGIKDSFRDETYQKTFLACCICNFFLPN